MKLLSRALLVAAVVFLSGAGAALAADLPLPPKVKKQPAPKLQPKMPPAMPAPEQKTETDFDKLGVDCIEATDGCRGYVRAADGKFDPTNNIGMGCLPKPLTCTKRK